MLTKEECAMLTWLTQHYFNDCGQVVELGSFVGGSTAHLAHGLRARGKSVNGKVHAFDRFTCAEDMKADLLYKKGIAPFEGESILWLSQKLLSDYSSLINFVPGDVLDATWNEESIEILFIDVSKSYKLNDHIIQTFFPWLIAGHSIVIQQDYLLNSTPWNIATMELLDDHFELIGWTEQNSALFLCNKVPDAKTIERALSHNLTPDVVEKSILNAITRFPFQRQKETLAGALATFKQQPYVRNAWDFKVVNPSESTCRAWTDQA